MLTINNTLDGYLKDVEIKGNTIQDAENLADIRSVGDKVEGQELYEIPVLSCGKNLLNLSDFISGSLDWHTGNIVGNTSRCVNPNYIPIGENKILTFSSETKTEVFTICIYDIGKNFIESCSANTNNTKTISLNQNAHFIRICVTNSPTIKDVQLEEGTVATPYEPYVEDKITILSPVQLEKVGDVADRIICKDGVWGVEKNVGQLNLFDISWTLKETLTNTLRFGISSHMNVFVTSSPCITNIVPYIYNDNSDSPHVRIDGTSPNGLIRLWVNKVDLATQDVKGLVNYLKQKNAYIKYILTTPQFIPLPHDQQVKLRTFANKTNISFLTEIEGMIKAQVPKSLGATVNTHTEQINNLNNELDRVKKLEESTVSTVTTESDFTTVEATSNGYFEDVKLEGKTLVNLCPWKFPNSDWVGGNGSWLHMTYKHPRLEVGKTYSICVYGNFSNFSYVQLGHANGLSPLQITMRELGKFFKFTAQEITTNGITIIIGKTVSEGFTETEKSSLKVILLEGDHTQNPPSYFEGLKSAGDTTDEIVVSSVKGDGNLFDGLIKKDITLGSSNGIEKPFVGENCTDFIEINRNEVYFTTDANINASTNYWFLMSYDKNKSFLKNTSITSKNMRFEFSLDTKYIRVGRILSATPYTYLNLTYFENVASVIEFSSKDKKRLLYYNNETQTWEKPILRQWDSIEKHADGKYYYHQRSGEVVVDGANWFAFEERENTVRVTRNNVKDVGFNNFITDKYVVRDIYRIDVEGIQGSATSKDMFLSINKNKLSEVSLAGVTNYLNTNPFTVVYQLAQEKVYECTNIDLITYANETNYVVESGVIVPKTTLKVHNNISNVVSLLQKKVSLLEDTVTDYMITQNRLMLASRYNADTVSFKVDVATLRNSFEYDNDLYELILNNILVGKDNYNREYIENLIIFYWMDFVISDEMYLTLFEIIEEQHNPKVIEEAPIE